VGSILFIALVIYTIINSHIVARNFDEIIQNPTFTGVVVRKGTIAEERALIGSIPARYILQIAGEYFNDDEKIQFDRMFFVSPEVFHRFETGDVISHDMFVDSGYIDLV